MKTLHIVANASASGVLRSSLREKEIQEEVLLCEGLFQYAPLFANNEQLERRAEALCGMLAARSFSAEKYVEGITDFLNTDFFRYDRVVVWHGSNAEEQLLLRFVASLVKKSLWEVDVTRIRSLLPNPNMGNIALSACDSKQISFLLGCKEPLTNERHEALASEWTVSSFPQAELRMWHEDHIVPLSVTTFDNILVEECQTTRSATRVVGKLLVQIDFAFGDTFLFTRLLHLVEQGRLDRTLLPDFLNNSI